MYTKIISSSIFTDDEVNTWFFLVHGLDGSIYSYNTKTLSSIENKSNMVSKLNSLIKGGFINTDAWRLI